MADGTTFNADDLDQNEVIVLGERTGEIDIIGRRNRVIIGEGARFDGCLEIRGDDNLIEIGRFTTINGSYLGVVTNGGTITVGEGSSIIHSALHVYEPGRIDIGVDCAVSANVWIGNTDMHPIYDAETGKRLNSACDVTIGDHVWIGLRSIILKGSRIADGAIIGAGSTVTSAVAAKTASAGSPLRTIRENVEWEWSERQTLSAPSKAPMAAMAS